MEGIAHQDYLKKIRYKNADNLGAWANIHQRFSANPYRRFPWQFDKPGIQTVNRVRDVGCGPASPWLHQHQRLPEEAQAACCDLSQGMAETAAAASRSVNPVE